MPVVSISNQSSGPYATYTGIEAARLREVAPDSFNLGNFFNTIASYGSGDRSRLLLKFPGLVNITGPVTVNSAFLRMYCYDQDATRDMELLKVISSNIITDVSWNERDITGNVAWVSDGGRNATNADLTPLASVATWANLSSRSFTSAAFNSYIQDLINGAATDHGVLISVTPDTAYDGLVIRFNGTDSAADAVWLEVDYTVGSPPTGRPGQRPHLFNTRGFLPGLRS